MRTSASPNDRQPSQDGELVLWEPSDPMLGSLLLRYRNVVVRLLGGLAWSNRLDLIRYLEQSFGTNSESVSHGARVTAPEIREVKVPAIVHAGETVEMEVQVRNITGPSVLLGSDNTNVTARWGDKPKLIYRAPEKEGNDTIDLVIASRDNLLSKKEISIPVH